MEYVQGESLKSMIQMTKRLRLGTIVRLAQQICAGLAEAHRQGVIHGDLKPTNIMVGQDGNARIMDLGTGAAAIPGTPEYMSPEQAEGQEPDQRSDIYSLGVILYEMVTGVVPFQGGSRPEILARQINEPPEPPRAIHPELPDSLNRVILRCLEKKRENRYQRAEELLRDLEEAPTSTVTGVTRPVWERPRPPAPGIRGLTPRKRVACRLRLPGRPGGRVFCLEVHQEETPGRSRGQIDRCGHQFRQPDRRPKL